MQTPEIFTEFVMGGKKKDGIRQQQQQQKQNKKDRNISRQRQPEGLTLRTHNLSLVPLLPLLIIPTHSLKAVAASLYGLYNNFKAGQDYRDV